MFDFYLDKISFVDTLIEQLEHIADFNSTL